MATPSKSAIDSIYETLDSDHNGLLTKTELKKGLQRLKLPADDSVIDDLFRAFDVPDTTGVTLEQFRAFSVKRSNELQTVFQELDTNKNGKLELDEVKASLLKVGLPAEDEDVVRLMKRMDRDGDGVINYEEWKELLLWIPSTKTESLMRYWANASTLFIDEMIVPQDPFQSYKETAGLMAAGATAGVLSKTLTAPLERLKVLYQITSGKPPPVMTVLKDIWAEGGVKAFFRGNGAALMKVAPEMALKMTVFDKIKKFFSEDDAAVKPWQRFAAGGIAGATCHTLMFPLEVVKLRLTASPKGTYSGVGDVFSKIWHNEGKFYPFYRGLVPCLMNTIPHNGINLMVYETLKEEMIKRKLTTPEPSAKALMACSGSATIIGQLICYPFHVVMARLAIQGMPGREKLYNGTVDAFVKIYKNEGPRSFYRGMGVSFIKSVPAHSISLTVYEYFKRTLKIQKAKKGHH
eukprot:TRINITY_DN2515_c0_g1_i1.p1 TRINITY_DN2515_c0_g1~~TRINITY_DN2515_c0_g1_i1.p1  ORF type:complete len:463 (-),score=143.75 TRINITY_DN2515_c0_g1_i1:67-1455(-)